MDGVDFSRSDFTMSDLSEAHMRFSHLDTADFSGRRAEIYAEIYAEVRRRAVVFLNASS